MEIPKLHASVPKLAFRGNFIIVLKHISARNLKNILKLFKKNTLLWDHMGPILLRKSLTLMNNHKFVNKHIKGIKSIKNINVVLR